MQDVQTWCFGDFWELLNKELADLGEAEALHGDARYFYDSLADYSPHAAAIMLAEDRADNPAPVIHGYTLARRRLRHD